MKLGNRRKIYQINQNQGVELASDGNMHREVKVQAMKASRISGEVSYGENKPKN